MKAEEKRTADGLLAKLHYGVVQLFNEATNCLVIAEKECKDISPKLMVCISFQLKNGTILCKQFACPHLFCYLCRITFHVLRLCMS